jgi:hypothetical protein
VLASLTGCLLPLSAACLQPLRPVEFYETLVSRRQLRSRLRAVLLPAKSAPRRPMSLSDRCMPLMHHVVADEFTASKQRQQ